MEGRLSIYYLDRLEAQISSDDEFSEKISKNSEEDSTKVEALNTVIMNSERQLPKLKFGAFKTRFKQNDVIMHSEIRQCSVLFKNILYKMQFEPDEAAARILDFYEMVSIADTRFSPNSPEEAQKTPFSGIMFDLYSELCAKDDIEAAIRRKQAAKRAAKKTVLRKFRLNELYTQVSPNFQASTENLDIYRCVKNVYTVGTNVVNGVVMHRLAGLDNTSRKKTLSPFDCHILHIKYRKALYMFNMNTKFYKLNEEIKLRTPDG